MTTANDNPITAPAPDASQDAAAWQSALRLCGEQTREGVNPPKNDHAFEQHVAARSYTIKQAAKLIGVDGATLRQAAQELALDNFLDPRGKLRFPVRTFRPTAADPDLREMIAGYARMRPDDLRQVLALDQRALNSSIRQAGLSPKRVIWRMCAVCGICRRLSLSSSDCAWARRPSMATAMAQADAKPSAVDAAANAVSARRAANCATA